MKYELPRLTRMWTHLERQTGGGQVKGMGEKQIEIDKRLLRKRMEVGRLPFLPVSGQGGSDRAGQTSASGAPSTNPILPGGGKQQPDLSPPTSNPQGLQKDIDEISKTRSGEMDGG